MNELYQAFVAQVMERFEWAVKVLWTDSLTGELLYEIESKTELTPRTPHGFWDEWPATMSPAGNPLFMFAGESALHLAAIWAEALTGGIAVGRLVALERPLEFCKALSASESESWVQAAISEISKHTKTQVDSIDRFREVDVLQRSIQNEYLQWLNRCNQNETPLSGKPKHSLGSVLPDESSTPTTIPATYRYQENVKGEPLTARFCLERFGITDAMLSRKGKKHRIKSGRKYCYAWSLIKLLADEKLPEEK